MNTSGHLPVSEKATRNASKTRGKRRGRPKSRNGAKGSANGQHHVPAAGTLSRTKTLLLAALRVWELKHRISE